MNFGVGALTLDLSILGISSNNVVDESYITIMTSIALMDENSFINPKKVYYSLHVETYVDQHNFNLFHN